MCLLIAVPVNHLSADPRKGRMLLFFLPVGGIGCPSNDGCVCSILIADENTGLYAMNRLTRLSSSVCRGCIGLMVSSGWSFSL